MCFISDDWWSDRLDRLYPPAGSGNCVRLSGLPMDDFVFYFAKLRVVLFVLWLC